MPHTSRLLYKSCWRIWTYWLLSVRQATPKNPFTPSILIRPHITTLSPPNFTVSWTIRLVKGARGLRQIHWRPFFQDGLFLFRRTIWPAFSHFRYSFYIFLQIGASIYGVDLSIVFFYFDTSVLYVFQQFLLDSSTFHIYSIPMEEITPDLTRIFMYTKLYQANNTPY